MLTDVLALVLSIIAFRFSTRPATNQTTFGFYRLEIFAAQINGGVLVGLAVFIFYEAYQRLVHPEPVKSLLMLAVAAIGLMANMASAIILHASSKTNLNVRASFLHILGDLIASAGVLVGGVIIALTGWYAVDPVVSIIIGLIILRGGYGVVKETATILLEAVPRHIDLDTLIAEIETLEGVITFHHVHVWTIASGLYALSGHVQLQDQMLSEGAVILDEIRHHLHKRFGITHTTLQLESESCGPDLVCSLHDTRSDE
jgi:cobalt-zinc-cadmium efflux system protein